MYNGYILMLLPTLIFISRPSLNTEAATQSRNKMVSDVEALDITWATLMRMYNQSTGGKQPTARFYSSAFSTMKAVAQAHASSTSQTKASIDVGTLKDHLKWAYEQRNFQGVKEQFGKTLVALFSIQLSKVEEKKVERKPGRSRKPDRVQSFAEAASVFLGALEDDLGPELFGQLVVKEGDTSLIFVIDETGSMANEIRTAKAIALAIIKEKRNGNVSYILSAFNDPHVSPPILMRSEQRIQFIKAIHDLVPNGGGDCPEMAFTGIINALNAGAQYGSQMIVFTDASAKDDTAENIDIAKQAASALGITISFFTNINGCSKEKVKSFEELAAYTNGQVFALKNDRELLQLSNWLSDSLQSRSTISVSRNSEKLYSGTKRKSPFDRRPIIVDDTVEVLDVSVTVTKGRHSKKHVFLKRPDGVIVKPVRALAQHLQFKISKPMPGTWILMVSGQVGTHNTVVKGSGDKTIEFGYMFLYESSRTISPIDHPLLGYETVIRVVIGGLDNVDPGSLYLQTVDQFNNIMEGPIDMYPIGSLGVVMEGYLHVESNKTFQVQLKGMTRAGKPFLRVGIQQEVPKPALILVLYARKVSGETDFTVARGTRTFIVIALRNFGDKDVFHIQASTNDGDCQVTRTTIALRKYREGFTGIKFRPRSTMKHGQAAVIRMKAYAKKSGVTIRNTVRLLIIKKDNP